MLKDDFYTITQTDIKYANYLFVLTLNEKHPVYAGHFPGQPVVPGACMLKIVLELMETIFKQKITLVKAVDCKFLIPVDPIINNSLQADINFITSDDGKTEVTAKFYQTDSKNINFKCQLVVVKQ